MGRKGYTNVTIDSNEARSIRLGLASPFSNDFMLNAVLFKALISILISISVLIYLSNSVVL